MSEEFDALHVVVPPGSYPGNQISVAAPDGRFFQLTIPPGSKPGDTIEVHVVRANTGGVAAPAPLPTAVPVNDDPAPSAPSPSIFSSLSNSLSSVTRPAAQVPAPVAAPAPAPQTAPSGAKTAVAAGVTAVVVGTLVIGPVTGLACAAGAVYATTRSDALGDAARAVGVASLVAFQKAKEVDQKYGIMAGLKDAASKTAAKAAEINNEYHLTDRAAAAAASSAARVRELDAKYEVSSSVGRSVTQGVTRGAEAVTRAMMTQHLNPPHP